MKISIKLQTDSHNTYPSDTLIISRGYDNACVALQLSDDNREITVSREQLQAALKALKEISHE